MNAALFDRRFLQIGNGRLATGVLAAVLAWLAFGTNSVSGWTLLLPLAILIGLVIWHDQVTRRQQFAHRGIRFYEAALARLTDAWQGRGNAGERFANSQHVYADDLDVFGHGSMFERLCLARTAAGEDTLARWLQEPAGLATVLDRQKAVDELRDRLDLREDLALLGEDIRSSVHATTLADWSARPDAGFPAWGRWVAFAASVAIVVSFGLYVAHLAGLRPFVLMIPVIITLFFLFRKATNVVHDSVQVPAHDLGILALVLARLEREQFQSPRLRQLRAMLNTDGVPASQRIAHLETMVEHMESAHNQFFAVFAFALLWAPQFAMAIEAWRKRNGRDIARWLEAVGELEALSSLAAFAYERPDATFPQFADGQCFAAEGLRHPLLAPGVSVANDVSVGGEVRLLIVSGSNMSGKSTLLRAIGLNTVLAWAGSVVTAASLRVSPLAVGASMRVSDSLQEGKSRFYAEIMRLRQVVDLTGGERPALFLLDELLSGTNSHDRRIGAEGLIHSLLDRGAIGLVTTHDLALAQMADTLGASALNVHFEDQVENGEIHFDYRMRPGVVTRSNALELMRAVGLKV